MAAGMYWKILWVCVKKGACACACVSHCCGCDHCDEAQRQSSGHLET